MSWCLGFLEGDCVAKGQNLFWEEGIRTFFRYT